MIEALTPRVCLLAAVCLASLACSRKKEIPTFRAAAPDAPPAGAETRQPRPLRWLPPETWEKEKPGDFQIARYHIAPGISASVSRMPGDAGGVAANVNRWRAQVGLEPRPDPAGGAIQLAEGHRANWFELKGPEQSILATIIPVDGDTWFFKLDTPTAALETARPGFMDFLKSIEIGHIRDPMPGINLSPPDGWLEEQATPPRFASYRIPASAPDGIDGDVSVIPVPGDGGATLGNVNLWRAQLRLPPLEGHDDPELGETTTPHGRLTIVHMTSGEALFSGGRHGSISAAILRTADTVWFFKLAGESRMVAAHRARFVDFVRTADPR